MKKTNIEFTILNSKNETATINCYTDSDSKILYRGGLAIRCTCSDKDGDYYLVYDQGKVYCPNCGRTAINVKSDNNLHLIPVGLDRNTMQELYRLSDTIDYSIWLTVADMFFKLKPADVDLPYTPDYVGWVTPIPELVESALNIREDLQVCNRDIESELESIIKDQQPNNTVLSEVEIFDIVDRLHEVFSVVETPYGEFQLYDASLNDDYIVENPLFPLNPRIGNGECWYVKYTSDEIWYIRYNYRDGDDLRMNNVLIDFELKAIGKVIPYDADVDTLLQKLKNNIKEEKIDGLELH